MLSKSKSRFADSSAIFQPLENRLLLAATHAIWQVLGTPKDDVIDISLSSTNANRLIASLNGKVVAKRRISTVQSIFVSTGAGNDKITINLGASNPISALIDGGAGNDTLTGGAGNDSLAGGAGKDVIHGGLGNDILNGGNGNNSLYGDEGNDTLKGGVKSDLLIGGLGDDLLEGNRGNDKLSGGYGDDSLQGNIGNDELVGGNGDNTLIGGAGRDTLHRDQSSSKKSRYVSDKSDIWQNDFSSNPLETVDDLDALKQTLIERAVNQYKNLFGQNAWCWPELPTYYVDENQFFDLVTTNFTTNPQATDHSSTNTQVADVDEADLVKTDGDYIYLIDDQQLVILDAYPADQTSIVSTTPLYGYGNGHIYYGSGVDLYLDGDRLTVIGTRSVYEDGSIENPRIGFFLDCAYRAYTVQTVVTVYNVADRANPQVVSETALDGDISSSRDINGKIYLVMNESITFPRPLIIENEDNPPEESTVTTDDETVLYIKPTIFSQYIYESEEAYRARLEALDITQLLPGYTVAQGDDTTTGSLVQTSKLYAQQNPSNGNGIFSIVTIDAQAATPGPIDECSILGFGGQIYMAPDALYVAATSYTDPIGNWTGDPTTSIYKFDVNDLGVDLGGAGQVPGWILNSYSMDQYEGYFRIATTTNDVINTTVDDSTTPTTGATSSNNLFVLQDTGDTLDVVGALTGLALTERIYSARFDGDRTFLVTFRQVDPLFTIDLSDPANPLVAGELKVPGYSSYLLPIGKDLLLGIGRNINDSSEPTGLKASLFNVSDPANPTLIDTYYFSSDYSSELNNWWNSWTSSPAEWNPHALSYYPDQQILALPVLDYGWWHGNAKLQLLHIDPVEGFTTLGAIQQSGEVLRSLRIGNYIYSISTTEMKVVSIDDPTQTVANIILNDHTLGYLFLN